MLDIAKVVTRSSSGRFDNVVFFDRKTEDVDKTNRAIPGAIGFPGEFLKTVLQQDDEGDNAADQSSPLDTPVEEPDTAKVRGAQRHKENRRKFIKRFPFDILNFDLEKFFFTPNDPMPGKMVKALREIFDWQKNVGLDHEGKPVEIDSFSLMFTTQIGPPNLTDDYLGKLETCLIQNIGGSQSLRTAFNSRVGHEDVGQLRGTDFSLFYKLAMPKVLASLLKESGWMIEPEEGIKLHVISRPSASGGYQMLHLTMQVRRQPPSLPGVQDNDVANGHLRVIEKLFREQAIQVTDEFVEAMKLDLQQDLGKIIARRQKYMEGKH